MEMDSNQESSRNILKMSSEVTVRCSLQEESTHSSAYKRNQHILLYHISVREDEGEECQE